VTAARAAKWIGRMSRRRQREEWREDVPAAAARGMEDALGAAAQD
jgi:hypothetical protein